jgi:hypothetical protein
VNLPTPETCGTFPIRPPGCFLGVLGSVGGNR